MAYTTVDNPTDYFNTVLFSGNETARSITGVGFQPDWVWIKDRSQAYNHHLFDVIRGATKRLKSDVDDQESTNAQTLTAFGSDGFSLGTDNATNGNGSNVVSWNWKAGGSASSNSDGSITSSVSANTTSGFSIVSYTGTGSAGTVGHGLSSAPKMILFKNRSRNIHWVTYDSNGGAGKYLHLEDTYAYSSSTVMFNNTEPTSSVFSIGGNNQNNASSENIIAYCFADVQGYSKFGSYTGNGNASGPFVYTGFKPAWVLQKNVSATQGWQLQDNKREGYNGDNDLLQPHDSAAESGVNRIDILSNGFKVITTDAGQNTNGSNYIYMCFAESPFVSSSGIPTTAR
jgi:hypothetical protein